ncbi:MULTISPECIES: YidC/Oxa1 family membrane protein insertase [unclassified Halanaerobium]|uniref:YidC/Oxa1 family membrane protein insertase n=1 Tax=unclassified Halanaerobium TaxID=2641197 RepID=UPI000E194A3F|nr:MULTISPECIES: YidC/Oxa1 family membrane protein insertase [unclassified Halanaerobium]RCW41463.1 protein translocase subunit yidC [Halanaerobium sp. MA284_MarDTE_T2]RCW79737.1 protein translocase subunit yidC [Halanaerobium sp. DL-01]
MFIFSWLSDFMTNALVFIHSLVGNYGLAIIIFTLIIKILLYPLTAKQTRSMKEMQELQPEIKKIQNKYKDNKEKQQEEMMDLYKKHNINPAAGCLPMILQLIILIPLYRSILAMGPTMQSSTFLWIGTLTSGSLAEPDVAIVILNAVVMIGQTYLTQKMSGSGQKGNMMMWIMPLFIVFIGFQLPAGVLLYWFTSTLFTVVQQYILANEPSKIKEAAE